MFTHNAVGTDITAMIRRHVDEDLEPYVCLAEECSHPLSFFPRYKHWVLHMEQAHMHAQHWLQHLSNETRWGCITGHSEVLKFENSSDLLNHTLEFHSEEASLKFYLAELEAAVGGSVSDKTPPVLEGNRLHPEFVKQYAAAVDAAMDDCRIIIPQRTDICPLCQCHSDQIPATYTDRARPAANSARGVDLIKMSRHIGAHLKTLSFWSIAGLDINPANGDDDQEASDKASKGRGQDSGSVSIHTIGSSHNDIPISVPELAPNNPFGREQDHFLASKGL
ncbi:hypothetical protein QBC46DRAFT_369146 [Diplogelasinospora grovesii]|uniref:C2H2-type domain-containing protein n=1 Tax=Diplogelasinospora grovesii TaxID=303347 RepID=A0AAN6NM67_9PEZI|nr:hypothetical protein QBC46DRAFT_369146 [Diplogelasinospora grovesii]